MSTPLRLENYSEAYLEFFRQALRKEVEVVCESPEQAALLRKDLNNFRQQYCKEPHRRINDITCSDLICIILHVRNSSVISEYIRRTN